MPSCPGCGGSEFEKRGTRRTYHELDHNLNLDGWNEGDVEMDTDASGEEIICCLTCDREYVEAELTGA